MRCPICPNLQSGLKNATIKGSIIRGKCDFLATFGNTGLRIAYQLCVGYLILDPVVLSLMIDTGSLPSVSSVFLNVVLLGTLL